MITPMTAMIVAMAQSMAERRAEVSSIRYGRNNDILFDWRGQTYSFPEPHDVIVVGHDGTPLEEKAKSYCVRQLLSGATIPRLEASCTA